MPNHVRTPLEGNCTTEKQRQLTMLRTALKGVMGCSPCHRKQPHNRQYALLGHLFHQTGGVLMDTSQAGKALSHAMLHMACQIHSDIVDRFVQ